SAAGTYVWSEGFGTSFILGEVARAVAVDRSGNVIITGTMVSTLDFGGGPLFSTSYDIFVAKFSVDGVHLWSKRAGDTYDDHGNSVAVDGSGNVVVTGDFATSVNFGGDTLTSPGGTDAFLVKFAP